jgi:O-antigen ligase
VATALAAIILTILIVSFRPFQPAGGEIEGSGGDIVNQIGFSALGAASIFALFALADRRRLVALISPWWLLSIGFIVLSALNATLPAEAMRSAMFTLIAILAVVAVLALPRDADAFCVTLLVCGFVAVGLSYWGVMFLPDVAIHSANSDEPQHAGLWRGLFSHKNIAGPIMANFSFAGLYIFRRGWRWTGGFLFAAAIVFMANTGSKTTAGLVPAAICFVVLPGVFGVRFLTPVFFLLALAVNALATLGIVFIDPIKHLAAELVPGLTYSGRTPVWEFTGEMIAKRPWTGYGLDSFWGTPFLHDQSQPFDRSWDIRNIVNGHDGYLDIAVIMGIPALCAAFVTLILAPARDYLRAPMLKENVYLADFFMTVLLFTALNAFMESFFFSRANPVWMCYALAALGLRMVARVPIPSSRPPS